MMVTTTVMVYGDNSARFGWWLFLTTRNVLELIRFIFGSTFKSNATKIVLTLLCAKVDMHRQASLNKLRRKTTLPFDNYYLV
jgi:hypothetical protein